MALSAPDSFRGPRETPVEAETELRARLSRPQWDGADPPTFAKHWEEYLRDSAESTNKPSTLLAKRSTYRFHLGPAFGKTRVDEIKVRQIDRFRAAKLKTHTAKTVNNMLTVLRHALDVAARWERIPAVPRVEWARVDRPPFRFLDFDEAERLVEAARPDLLVYTMIVVAVHTGLRLGELLALRWDAVDLRAGPRHVRQAVAVDVVGTPKSGRAREVPLNDTAVGALPEFRHLRELVFSNEDGSVRTKNGCSWGSSRSRATRTAASPRPTGRSVGPTAALRRTPPRAPPLPELPSDFPLHFA